MNWKIGIATVGVVTGVGLAYGFAGRGRITQVNGTPWRNSLADAQEESRRTGKPILLLSMFGRLDEDLPCANARTLRATLFKDPEFKAFADKEVIPAWEMVRPVPHVTIDFGDGKKLVRTVRGNAVMYLVNADGKVFDAFPGIYTKADFLPAARESIEMLARADLKTVAAFHSQRAVDIRSTFITASKSVAESPTLDLMGARPIAGAIVDSKTAGSDLAKRRFLEQASRLSDLSLNPIPAAIVLGRSTNNGQTEFAPTEILKRDSATNMSRTRAVVHYYFAAEKVLPTPAEARDAVLGTILKIPYKDPTLGLSDVLMPGTPG